MLTKGQEKEVIALAQKCGIKKIEKISTHNMFPSPYRGVRVQGAEQVKGREVSYQVLSISQRGVVAAWSQAREGAGPVGWLLGG